MINKHLLNKTTAEIITWLDCNDYEPAVSRIQLWDEPTWSAAKMAAIMQGVGPYLNELLPHTPLYAHSPGWFQEWLGTTYSLNAERVARFHSDLKTLLREAHCAGIPVMPIKGSLLTTQIYPDPAIRPMADLDLLVYPADRQKMGQLLIKQGYTFVPPDTKWSHHDLYINPSGHTVVSAEEHPDNPRPVEVHTSLEANLWADFPTPDLTSDFWETGQGGKLLSEAAILPAPIEHLAYLSIHHLRHMLLGSGRAMQWLDLALMVKTIRTPICLPYQNLLYPAFKLAARAFPSYFTELNWEQISQGASSHVRTWCESSPLDERCGLQMAPGGKASKRWYLRWRRWHPTPVRLSLAYQDTPLPVAYLRYGRVTIRAFTQR